MTLMHICWATPTHKSMNTPQKAGANSLETAALASQHHAHATHIGMTKIMKNWMARGLENPDLNRWGVVAETQSFFSGHS
jgi:hypothetical protein